MYHRSCLFLPLLSLLCLLVCLDSSVLFLQAAPSSHLSEPNTNTFSKFSARVAGYSPYIPGGNPRCFSDTELKALNITPQVEKYRQGIYMNIEKNEWQGQYVSSAVACILLEEALNIPCNVTSYLITTDQLGRLGRGDVDGVAELWPLSLPQMIADYEGQFAYNGALGVVGRSGWYVSTWTTKKTAPPAFRGLYPELYRGYEDPRLLALFDTPADIDDSLLVGAGRAFVPSWCAEETNPPGCDIHGPDFEARLCNITKWGNCIAAIAYSNDYDVFAQQMIVNNNLNISLMFMGDNMWNYVSARSLDASLPNPPPSPLPKPVFTYGWSPNGFFATQNLTRVTFPESTEACNAKNDGGLWGTGGVDCDFPAQGLLKVLGSRVKGAPQYHDVVTLFGGIVMTTDQQTNLLLNIPDDSSKWAPAAFETACGFLKSTSAQWSRYVENTIPPSPPPQRYLMLIKDSYVIGIRVVCCVLIVFSLLLHVGLHFYRGRSEIKRSSISFCHFIVGGSLFPYIAILLIPYISEQAYICATLPALFCAGFNLTFFSIFLKTYRVHRIFNLKAIKVQRLTNRYLMKYLLTFMLYDVVVHCIWIARDRLKVEITTTASDPLADVYTCTGNNLNIYLLALLLPKIALIIFSTYLAYSIRKVHANFNESKYIGLSLYSTMAAFLICAPFSLLINDYQSLYVIVFVAVILVFTSTILFLFVPKFACIFFFNNQVYTTDEKSSVEGTSYNSSTGGSVNHVSGTGNTRPQPHLSYHSGTVSGPSKPNQQPSAKGSVAKSPNSKLRERSGTMSNINPSLLTAPHTPAPPAGTSSATNSPNLGPTKLGRSASRGEDKILLTNTRHNHGNDANSAHNSPNLSHQPHHHNPGTKLTRVQYSGFPGIKRQYTVTSVKSDSRTAGMTSSPSSPVPHAWNAESIPRNTRAVSVTNGMLSDTALPPSPSVTVLASPQGPDNRTRERTLSSDLSQLPQLAAGHEAALAGRPNNTDNNNHVNGTNTHNTTNGKNTNNLAAPTEVAGVATCSLDNSAPVIVSSIVDGPSAQLDRQPSSQSLLGSESSLKHTETSLSRLDSRETMLPEQTPNRASTSPSSNHATINAANRTTDSAIASSDAQNNQNTILASIPNQVTSSAD